MAWIGAIGMVAAVLLLFWSFRLVDASRQAIAKARLAVEILGDPDKDDLEKEKALQRTALRMFVLFFWIAGGAALALFLPAALLEILSSVMPVRTEAVFEVALSWPFLTGLSVVIVAGIYLLRRRLPATAEDYSGTDRLLHNIAFISRPMQVALADLEDRMAASRVRDIAVERPVFVCGLPRAGTTLLLELLEEQGEFASHIYRDMPFLLIPYFWHRFSRKFRKSAEMRERTHGDGMQAGFDSAEAFEEMIWHEFWPEHYEKNRILPWEADGNVEFLSFFRNHIRKIIAVRSMEGRGWTRYLSKNNGNIARIAFLRAHFPDCTVIVPFREPVQQAASLLEQHRNFLELHRNDAFARRYMLAIGHFDFGANLKPIDFDGWLSGTVPDEALNLRFWVRYWVHAYRYLLNHAPEGCLWVSYDMLCETPERELIRIGQAAGIGDITVLAAKSGRFRAPVLHSADMSGVDAALLRQAEDLYRELRALNPIEEPRPVERGRGIE